MLYVDTFGGLEHDDFARGFSAPHVFCRQVIDAHILQIANTWCRAVLHQRGCATNHVSVVGACFCRVCNDGVRTGKVLQMEPHGMLGCAFNKCVILGLVCTHLDGVSAVENLGVHDATMLNHIKSASLNQFLHIANIDLKIANRKHAITTQTHSHSLRQ